MSSMKRPDSLHRPGVVAASYFEPAEEDDGVVEVEEEVVEEEVLEEVIFLVDEVAPADALFLQR
jgi:hypothetical protein